MAYLYDLTDTWNAAGTVFNAIKMNVTNTASAAGSKIVSLQVGATDRFTVDKDGNGYFSGTLQAVGSITAPNVYIGADSGTIGMQDNSASILAYNGTGSGGITNTLRFITGATERMRIDSSGNVGIGTSSPGEKLQVSGNIKLSAAENYLIFGNPSFPLYVGSGSGMLLAPNNNQQYAVLRGSTGVALTTDGNLGLFLNSSGNLGLGVTPSAWLSPYRALDIGTDTALVSQGGSTAYYFNSYRDSNGNFIYKTSAAASRYQQGDGAHYWHTAPSGTAGNAISFTQVMTLDASGRLMVGQTTNAAGFRVEITGAGGTAGDLGLDSNASYAEIQSFNSKPLYLNRQGNNTVLNATAGNVGVGTSSPGNKLDVSVTRSYGQSADIGIAVGGTDNGYVDTGAASAWRQYVAGNSTGQALRFDAYLRGTGWTERARIDSSGNLLVGTTSATFGASVGMRVFNNGSRMELGATDTTNDTVGYDMYSTGAGAYRFFVGWGGTIYATSTSISAISDQRLKENIRDLDAGLDTILALKPRRFDWKEGKGKDIKDDMGFIAQEVEEVLPALIGGWKAGEGEPDDLKSVKAGDLIPVLVKAIQELTARVAQLEGN